jgi:hypothetical protein
LEGFCLPAFRAKIYFISFWIFLVFSRYIYEVHQMAEDWMGRMARWKVGTKAWLESLMGRELGRPGHRWEDNIKMDRREIGFEWIVLTWFWLVNNGGFGRHRNETCLRVKHIQT